MPLNLSAGRLRKEHCATSIEYALRPGESKLGELDTDGIWDYMMKPIVDAQEAILRAREREDLIPLVQATQKTVGRILFPIKPCIR